MPAATFWAIHPESKSKAIVEFILQDKKVKLNAIFFTQGNVVDINVVRKMSEHAKKMLLG